MNKTKVNFGFISGLEGGPTCTGYVPDPKYSKSGVTIATGFDLGQRSVNDLQTLLPQALVQKLAPYCGLTKHDAVTALHDTPLSITPDDANLIDLCVKSQLLEQLQHRYNRDSVLPFDLLKEQQQTVIASVAFQYGNLARRCPNFWRAATQQNWHQMAIELRDFGDRYHSRRNREANYLDMAGI
jgi:hypothetical protein